jgi:predicted nucleic acid-binding protein
MEQGFLMDTNILIYVLANVFPNNREKLEHILENSFRAVCFLKLTIGFLKP